MGFGVRPHILLACELQAPSDNQCSGKHDYDHPSRHSREDVTRLGEAPSIPRREGTYAEDDHRCSIELLVHGRRGKTESDTKKERDGT